MNKKTNKTFARVLFLILLLLWCGIFLSKKIDLTNADIGRHIKNGEMIIHGSDELRHKVLHENLYSYTNPKYPFVNHHWGSGVLFYIIWNFFGFGGLSLFYIFLSLIGFLIVFFIAQKEAGFWLAYGIAIIVAPLVGLRSEIRPEVATYFILPILFWVLWNYRKGRISYRWLFVTPLFFAVWVNMNLYFIFGLYLIGLFWLEAVWNYFHEKKTNGKNRGAYYDRMMFFFVVGIISFLATFLNPWGIKGSFYPLLINSQIKMNVLELASPFVLKMTGALPTGFESYFLLLGVLFCCFALLFFRVFRKRFSFLIFVWALTLAFLSIWQARNVALFGIFMVPILAMTINATWSVFLEMIKKQDEDITAILLSEKFKKVLILIVIPYLFLLIGVFNINFFANKEKIIGIGIRDGVYNGMTFYIDNKLRGPILNDFDISSLVIFGLYPNEKVFIDHRPEAYPKEFFDEVFHQIFSDEDMWEKCQREYNFNSIIVTNNSAYIVLNKFVQRRKKDPEWELKYSDEYVFIFTKNKTHH